MYFPYWGKGVEISPLLFLLFCNFLPKGRKRLHLVCSRGYMKLAWVILSVFSIGMDAIHSPDGHLYIYCVFGEGTTKVVEEKVTLCPDVEIHSGKVSMLTYTVSVGGLLEAIVNQLKPCLNMI